MHLEAMAKSYTANAASLLVALFILFSTASAADPDMLQDLCVADINSAVKVNGFPCKASSLNVSYFCSDVLAKPGATNNSLGSNVTAANVMKVPGLNTLGISMSRIDYAPHGGLNPPHVHPRATEMVFVLEGQLEVGFITTDNKLITKIIRKGDVFVFPRGLVHFQRNSCHVPAAVIAAFNSQLPGTQSIATTLFAATPPVPDYVLGVAFQIDPTEVQKIKAGLAPKM